VSKWLQGEEVKRFLSLILLFVLSLAFLSPAFADETQTPSPPIETEQDKRDGLIFGTLNHQLQAKVQSALQLASKTGVVTTLDNSSVQEIVDLLNRRIQRYKVFENYNQNLADGYSKCAADFTLSNTELDKCQFAFKAYSSGANNASNFQEHFIKIRDGYVSAQERIKLAAAIYLANSKKTTITCIKGKLTKKVTAVKPKCPTGYKVKK
jgi:hypothetical protein